MPLLLSSVDSGDRSPALTALALHLVSIAILILFAHSLPADKLLTLPWPWLEAAIAATLGYVAGLPRWWLPINLLFVPALAVLTVVQIPPTLFFLAFILLFACNATAWHERVPLYLSNPAAARHLLRLLPARSGVRVLDLGCGTGGLLNALARARPDSVYHGIELAPLTFLIARWRASRCAAPCTIQWADFWTADLSQHDVVYAYLSPQPMARLWQKARQEMRRGALLVSNGFAIPGIQPTCVIETGDRLAPALYVWQM